METAVERTELNTLTGSKRIEWVDLCRGLAILLVMLGHSHEHSIVKDWLYTFHIPLFFFLSGYVFSVKKYSDYKSFLFNKIRTLLFPMFCFSIINFPISCALDGSFSLKDVVHLLGGTFIQLRGSAWDLGLWFLPCLFVLENYMWFLLKWSGARLKRLIPLILSVFIIGFLYIRLVNKIVPWSFEVACVSLLFFGCGYLAKLKGKIFDAFSTKVYLIPVFALASVLSSFGISRMGTMTDMYANAIPFLPLYLTGAFSGILLSVSVFRFLPHKPFKWLMYVGKNTLVFYSLHSTFFNLIKELIEVVAPSLYSSGSPVDFLVVIISKMVFSTIILAGISFILNRYCPWMVGKRRRNGS